MRAESVTCLDGSGDALLQAASPQRRKSIAEHARRKSCLALSLSYCAVNTLCTQLSLGNAILQPRFKQISSQTHQHAPSLPCFVHGVIPDPSYLHC